MLQNYGGITRNAGYNLPGLRNRANYTPLEPLVSVFGHDQLRLQRSIVRRPPENEDAEATIRWGRASNFETSPPTALAIKPDPENFDPDDDGFPDAVSTITFTEVSRKVNKKRVENPDDSDQYVMVEDATESIFRSDRDAILRKFVFASS